MNPSHVLAIIRYRFVRRNQADVCNPKITKQQNRLGDEDEASGLNNAT